MKGYENGATAHGMQEVIGSTPIFSTLIISHLNECLGGFFMPGV